MKKIISAVMALPFLAVSAFSESEKKVTSQEIYKNFKACKELETMGTLKLGSCDNLDPKKLSHLEEPEVEKLTFEDLGIISNEALEKSKDMITSESKNSCSKDEHKLVEAVKTMEKTRHKLMSNNPDLKNIDKLKQENHDLLKKLEGKCR